MSIVPLSSHTYSRGEARLPSGVEELNRLVPAPVLFLGAGPIRVVRIWLEAGAPAVGAPSPAIRRAVYRESSLANPANPFTWATFQETGAAPLTSLPASTLYRRLALEWLPGHRTSMALLLSYAATQVGRIHIPGPKEGNGFDLFQEAAAGDPYGQTNPKGIEPLPEVVHDHWKGSGSVLATPDLRDPRPLGQVEA